MCYTGAMPDSRTHDRITVYTGFALLPITYLLSADHSLLTALTVASGCLVSGLLFSCDLDINSIEYRRWGWLRFLWWPYKQAVPHRSWLSHGLVIGPLLRLAYFAALVYGSLFAGTMLTGNGAVLRAVERSVVVVLRDYATLVYAFLIGFVLGGAAHSIPDWFSTGAKRAYRQWTRL